MIMNDERLVNIVPSNKQLAIQEMEFYSFIHFTVNTFTDKEWGDGTESPLIFNPTELDANQWVFAVKEAGMKGLILTCKHHDGFCLWPSKYTEHSVKNSPYKNGQGDVVKEVSEACYEHGIKFGVYLSPWDRNNATYGYGTAYDDYFVNQLTELLTNYGEVFTVWFDGACGEGDNGKKQMYDWDRYYEVINTLMPQACINVCGSDVRWCGNEAAQTRESEWSVVPRSLTSAERIASLSQKVDDGNFINQKIKSNDLDLGSRKALENVKEIIWYPAEVNVSIRKGWFYHTYQDEEVRTAENIIDMYYRTVGGNTTFLLNLPPDTRGLIHENDVKVLQEVGEYIKKAFSHNVLQDCLKDISSDSDDGVNVIKNVLTDGYDEYFKTKDNVREAIIDINLEKECCVKNIVLKENIKLSQRVENFEVILYNNEKLVYCETFTVIGYKKIIRIDDIYANRVEIKIKDSRVCPTLSFIGIYD